MTQATGAIVDHASVIDAAANGDVAAFESLIAMHHEDLRRICHVVAGDAAIADDAVQAAWSIAWRKLGSLRDARRLRPWLASIAINEARRMHRERRRQVVTEIRASDHDAASATASDPAAYIAAIDLRNALARLTPEDRTLLALRYVAGFDSSELAAATGLSPSGTRNRLSRLLQRLQGELSDD